MFRDDRPFVFRHEACTLLREKLAGGARCITLVGPGGIGKSRLLAWASTELAEEPVAFVSLGATDDLAGVVASFVRVLELAGHDELSSLANVRELLTGDLGQPHEHVPRWVFLDDAERARGALRDLLSPRTGWRGRSKRAANVPRLLVSSREPLGIEGEEVVAVGGLDDDEAVALFRARVSEAHVPDVSWIHRFSAQLDGSPLALEIAASWLSLLSPEELERRFSIELGRASVDEASRPRHASLRDAVQGSWDLLSEAAREVLLSVSALPDGFTLGLCERAAGLGGTALLAVLDELRHRSLLRRAIANGVPRFHVYRAVLELAAARAEAVDPRRLARVEEAVLADPSEMANLWALVRREADGDRVARAALLLHTGLLESGPFALHLPLLLRARELSTSPSTRAELGVAFADVHRMRGELDALSEEVAHARAHPLPELLDERVHRLEGWLARMRGDLASATAHYEAAMALSRTAADGRAHAMALGELAVVKQSEGDTEGALVLHHRSLELHRASGDARQAGIALSYIAVATHRLGRMSEALVLHREALTGHVDAGNARYAAAERMHCGFVLFELGDIEAAREAYEASIEAHHRVRDRLLEAMSHVGLASVEGETGGERRRAAAECLARAENLLDKVHHPRISAALSTVRGHLYADAGSFPEALSAYEAAQEASHEVVVGPEALRDSYRALALFAMGRLAAAREAAAEGVARAANVKNPCILQAARAVSDGLGGQSLPSSHGVVSSDLRRVLRWFERAPRTKAADGHLTVGPALVVGTDVRWFALDGVRMDLGRRAAVRRIFQALVKQHETAPGSALPLAKLIEVGWPDERMQVEAAQKRAYTAIWTLRTQRLGEHLVTRDDGYLLAPHLRVQWEKVLP